jgi:hypothetical protein
MYELAEPNVLARGIRELIRMKDPPGEPVAIHRGEAAQRRTRRTAKPPHNRQGEPGPQRGPAGRRAS